jgi:hypothetical protein
LAKLSCKLEKTLGPNCYKTVEELDRNYHFQKKIIENAPFIDVKCFKKIKIAKQDKENFNMELKNSKLKHNKRNNSCEFLTTPSQKKIDIKQKQLSKKKHFSMDNLNSIMKDYQIKEIKPKLYGNWMKSSELRSPKRDQSKIRERNSQEKMRS